LTERFRIATEFLEASMHIYNEQSQDQDSVKARMSKVGQRATIVLFVCSLCLMLGGVLQLLANHNYISSSAETLVSILVLLTSASCFFYLFLLYKQLKRLRVLLPRDNQSINND